MHALARESFAEALLLWADSCYRRSRRPTFPYCPLAPSCVADLLLIPWHCGYFFPFLRSSFTTLDALGRLLSNGLRNELSYVFDLLSMCSDYRSSRALWWSDGCLEHTERAPIACTTTYLNTRARPPPCSRRSDLCTNRGVLLCMEKISEQSTYSLEGSLTSDNVMIGEQVKFRLLYPVPCSLHLAGSAGTFIHNSYFIIHHS